jgi:hypothetical protein
MNRVRARIRFSPIVLMKVVLPARFEPVIRADSRRRIMELPTGLSI